MLPHFRRNVIERTDELRFMPEVPFRYYILGLRDFVMAGEFDEFGAADAASCFINLVLQKLETKPESIVTILSELLPAIRHIATNQSIYEAIEDIYGSFQEKLKRIEFLHEALGGS